MSLFFVQRHIANLNQKLKQLDLTTNKLDLVSQKIQTLTTNKINSVCWADVKLRHTSQVMVNLGGGYFLETTKNAALGIAKRRKDYIRQNIEKLQKIKSGLLKKQGVEKGKGYQKRTIDKNQEGQDIFEIMEFPDQHDDDIKIQNQIQQTEQMRETKDQIPEKIPQKFVEEATKPIYPEIQKPPVQYVPQAPKRVSKFKQQRQQQRKN